MVRYLRGDQDFAFPADFGFSKSANTPSLYPARQGFAKGGKVVSPEAYGLTNGHVDPPVQTTRKTPIKTEVRSGLASGGQAAEPPGPSPAKGMQPLTRRPYKPVDVPSPLAEKGAKKIPVPVVTKAPAAAPPEEVSPMRKGGRVKRAHGGSIDVDEAADDFRRSRPDWAMNLNRTRPGYLDTDAKMEDTPVPGTRERGSGRGGITAPGEDPGPRDLARGGRVKRAMGGPMMGGPIPPPVAPGVPQAPQQPTPPVMPTLELPMPRMAKGGAIKRAKGGQVRKGCY